MGAELRNSVDLAFLTGLGASVATRLWLVLVGLVASVVVTRALGPEGRGYYSVALTISMIGTQVGVLGFNRSNIWAVARNDRHLGPLIGNSIAVSLVVGGLAALVVALALAMAVIDIPVPTSVLLVVLASIPVGIALTLLGNLFLGLDRIRDYNTVKLATGLGTAILSIVLVMLGAATVQSLLVIVVAVGSTVAVISVAWLARAAVSPVTIKLSLLRAHASYSLRAFPVSILTFLILRVDILIVQAFLGAAETGYYAVAVGVIEVLRILPATLGMQLLGRMTRDRRRGGPWRMAKVSSLSIGLMMSILSAVAAVFAGPAITLLYGEAFASAAAPLLVLLPGLVFVSVNGVLTSYLGSLGMPRGSMLAPGVGLVVNVSLNFMLIPVYGIVGAASASTFAYGAMLFTTIVYIRIRGLAAGGRDALFEIRPEDMQ